MNQSGAEHVICLPQQENLHSMLVFSIALNGYQWMYRHHLASHARYAHKLKADYVLIDRPLFTKMGTECCWLKLLLIKQALLKGYQSVLFLDADAMVDDSAPDIRENLTQDQHIYMAKGKSHRFNSGVMLLNNHPDAIAFISDVLGRRHLPVPEDCDVGWGENGHVIQVARQYPCVKELDLTWNNTWQPKLKDYIRHFNYGVMRDQQLHHRWLNLSHWCLARMTRLINKSDSITAKITSAKPEKASSLEDLLTLTCQLYPKFFGFGH